MMPPHNSLVKYDNAILVSTTKDRAGGKQKKSLPPVESKQPSQTEDILNSILPPREWTEDGQLWVQYVSSTPATRLDVINLQEQLDQKLQQRQARETGICPIREELYAQCFGECARLRQGAGRSCRVGGFVGSVGSRKVPGRGDRRAVGGAEGGWGVQKSAPPHPSLPSSVLLLSVTSHPPASCLYHAYRQRADPSLPRASHAPNPRLPPHSQLARHTF